MTENQTAGVNVTALTHDLTRKRSLVTVVWDDQSDRKLVLEVPFGCAIDDARDEAEKAVRALSTEIGAIAVNEAK